MPLSRSICSRCKRTARSSVIKCLFLLQICANHCNIVFSLLSSLYHGTQKKTRGFERPQVDWLLLLPGKGLLDIVDGIFFHTARRRDNHQIAYLVAQQRFTHRRLIGDQSCRRFSFKCANDGVVVLSCIGSAQVLQLSKCALSSVVRQELCFHLCFPSLSGRFLYPTRLP